MRPLTPPAVDTYLDGLSRPPHPVLARIRDEGRTAGIPIVDPLTGALLHGLARAAGATRVLEIGTAIGYSAVWLATALPPSGLLVSLERDPARATTARAYFAEAGLDDRVNVVVGEASRYLHKLAGPFDLIFQDGDKTQYGSMLDALAGLLRLGGLLVTDNVLWYGEVVPDLVEAPVKPPEQTAAIADYNQRLAADPRFTTSWLPVGDGVAVSVRNP
ncbi:MAG: O-methyltransferase [Vicinamibacterales bacterium]